MKTIDRVIIDYGHGGMIAGEYQTPGGKQYHFTQPEKFDIYEGVFNRGAASKLMNLLFAAGVQTYDCVAGKYVTEAMNAESLEQSDVSLSQRVANANGENKSGTTLFISIHANAIGNGITGPSQSARGASVYVYKASSDAGEIASELLAQYANTGLRPRKVVEETSFYVLKKTTMPALLSENGFFTNIEDAKYIMTDQGQMEVAKAHFDSIKDKLNIQKPCPTCGRPIS
tara:strand:- start:6872 stop:7558 length:687 start_codon:yes stop_codon:yes gene_type:complete